ncbi:MAG: hypothetical protein JWQ23_3586, partial [Herminiimonas sp.]|nr:hypothetical protein [Herminiimonas sp.]
MKCLLTAALLFAATLSSAPVSAQTAAFPSRPIKIMVGSSAGGYLDVITRAVARELSAQWGQPIIVDNKPGASGSIAAASVAKAAPDGYTWLAATEAHLMVNKYTQKNLPYDFKRDFIGISILAKADQMVVATPSVPANTLPELVELLKQQPDKYSYGSWGAGSHPHLFFAKLGQMEKVNILQVPYKGVAPTLLALSSGEVQVSVMSAGTARPLLDAGKLKVLAAASRERSPTFPDIPTTEELGYKGLQSSIWMVFLLPADTPKEIVARSSEAVVAILKRP